MHSTSPTLRDTQFLNNLQRELERASDRQILQVWEEVEATSWLLPVLGERAQAELAIKRALVTTQMRRRGIPEITPQDVAEAICEIEALPPSLRENAPQMTFYELPPDVLVEAMELLKMEGGKRYYWSDPGESQEGPETGL